MAWFSPKFERVGESLQVEIMLVRVDPEAWGDGTGG